MGFILAIVARCLIMVFMPIGILYSIIKLYASFRFKDSIKRINSYFFVIAVSIDQMGNVIMQDLFNDLLIKKNGYKFGNEDETISSVIGKNKMQKSLSLLGLLTDRMLEFFEKNHSIKSIEN